MPEHAAKPVAKTLRDDPQRRTAGRQKGPVRHTSRERYDRILEATARLLATGDFDTIVIGQIATESGLNRTSVYNFFESTGDIFAALTQRYIRTFDDYAAAALPKRMPRDVYDRIDRIVDVVVDGLNKQPVAAKCMFSGSKYDAYLVEAEFEQICASFYRRFTSTCIQTIPEGPPDPLRTLSFIHASFYQSSIRRCGYITPETLSEMKRAGRGYLREVLGE